MVMAVTGMAIPTLRAPAVVFSRSRPGGVCLGTSRRPVNIRACEAMDPFKVTPRGDRVLVRLEELSEKSEGGVLLPKSAVKFERYLIGEVISIGKEAEAVEKGQKVMLSDINAYEVNFGTDEKLCFCRAGDLLATVE